MTYFDLLVCALATWHAVEVWHHGSIFANARGFLENRDSWFADLMLCPFCLSFHTAMILTAWYVVADVFPGSTFWRIPVLGMAVARCANLANDMLHRWCRTPRIDFDTDEQPDKMYRPSA